MVKRRAKTKPKSPKPPIKRRSLRPNPSGKASSARRKKSVRTPKKAGKPQAKTTKPVIAPPVQEMTTSATIPPREAAHAPFAVDEVTSVVDEDRAGPVLAEASPNGDVADSEPYELHEDPLDPGWILFAGLKAEMRRQLAAVVAERRSEAFHDLFHWIGGGARPGRMSRCLIVWHGHKGSLVPAGLSLASSDGTRQAQMFGSGFRLGSLVRVQGITSDGSYIDLPQNANADISEELPADLRAIRFNIQMPEASSIDGRTKRVFPGLLWDVPAVIALRLRGLRHVGSQRRLRWTCDAEGRLFVPPQVLDQTTDVASAGSGAVQLFDMEIPIALGEWQYCGRMHLNVSPVRVINEFPPLEVPAGTFTAAIDDASKELHATQLYTGWSGNTEEEVSAWERRMSGKVRHGGRCVTRADYADLLRDLVPDAHPLEIAATRVRCVQRFEDAVRLTVIPREWHSFADLLGNALLMARRITRLFAHRALTRVVTGPPSLLVAQTPGPRDALWPYRDYLTAQRTAMVCRSEGVFWPVLSEADLRAKL